MTIGQTVLCERSEAAVDLLIAEAGILVNALPRSSATRVAACFSRWSAARKALNAVARTRETSIGGASVKKFVSRQIDGFVHHAPTWGYHDGVAGPTWSPPGASPARSCPHLGTAK